MKKITLGIFIGCIITALCILAWFNVRPISDKIPDVPMPTPPHVTSTQCGIDSCHGLDISCSTNAPQECDLMYRLGDNCRQFVQCRKEQGQCIKIEDPKFTKCKSCVETCENNYPNDPPSLFGCESKCTN